MKNFILLLLSLVVYGDGFAQDSVTVNLRPDYDTKGRFHRWLFGENYRREWAAEVTLPTLRISSFQGGLKPEKLGGGMQSKSLRLVDRAGREWVIRSVEKNPDAVLPEALRKSFARDWVDDATSAQHPFAALVIPPIAKATGIPHSKPMIVVIAPDSALGQYLSEFAHMVALVEEREPIGNSDNTEKMKAQLAGDNDNRLDGRMMLRARLLDMLVGDWDRHEDQWRWVDTAKGKTKFYLPVPRDRDQVFHVTQGLIPKIASREYVLPYIRNFEPSIRRPEWLSFKTRFVNALPSFQMSKDEWLKETRWFQQQVTDSVLEAALSEMPPEIYRIRHNTLLSTLKSRRDRLHIAAEKYYNFIHKIVDIQLTKKKEWVAVRNDDSGNVHVSISKVSKKGEIEDLMLNKTFKQNLTEEIRVYGLGGDDSITDVRTKKNLRIRYADTPFTPVNLYNTLMPLAWVGLNLDDGLIIGAGFRYTKQEGFRKEPYASRHQLSAGYAFATNAYRINYRGEWTDVVSNADFVLDATARAPNNTINFFGRGNETRFIKSGDKYIRFYRTRFTTYQLSPALRWNSENSEFSAGPSLYYYSYSDSDNKGRFITNTNEIGSYDSAVIGEQKLHAGLVAGFSHDTRDIPAIPRRGWRLNVRLQAYKGASRHARDFAQILPEVSFYQPLGHKSRVILANRTGGVLGFGEAAFYQSAFIGGHDNLRGFRQYRFAGRHSIYNNFELRVHVADVASYLLPGQFGVTGFWDMGRVWEKHDKSGKLHHGFGGGIYFAPASLVAFNLVLGYSEEGVLPYFTMGFRF